MGKRVRGGTKMAVPADPSLLAAELGGGEGGGEEALRRLLQLPPDEDGGGPPPTGPSRAVTPQPGLCVKTLSGGAKFFVNVCHAPEVPPPPPLPPPPALRRLLASPDPGAFRIPMSLGEPHQERDRGGQPCTAYDVVINSDFFRTLQADPLYLEFFLTVAMEGLGEKYGVELGQTGWRLLRHRRFMGTPGVQRIRARPQIQELDGPPAAPPCPPLWVVLAQPSAQRPRVLQARVLLPQLEGADSLSLQLSEDLLVLGGPGGGGEKKFGGGSSPPAPPLLTLGLPLPADPPRCRARFHPRTKVLTVTIPLQA